MSYSFAYTRFYRRDDCGFVAKRHKQKESMAKGSKRRSFETLALRSADACAFRLQLERPVRDVIKLVLIMIRCWVRVRCHSSTKGHASWRPCLPYSDTRKEILHYHDRAGNVMATDKLERTRQRKSCAKNHAFSFGFYRARSELLRVRCLVRREFDSQMDRMGNAAYQTSL